MVSVPFVTFCCMALNSASITQLTMSSSSTSKPQRVSTLRSISSTLSGKSAGSISERTDGMVERAKKGTPLTEDEVQDVVNSIQNISPIENDTISLEELKKVLLDVAHLSHKDWAVTGNNAKKLGAVLMKDGVSPHTRQMLERILEEGNWDGAAKHATERPTSAKPWAVLVTGVNGIRKTTSIYQPWFPALLKEALAAPAGQPADFENDALPAGSNSFFRQLDHLIATLANEDFAQLYVLTQELLKEHSIENPPPEVVKQYSDLKAAIFTRYRTLSELLGALLLGEAQILKSNCMLETSGRDVAMFHYVDHFFPTGYSKLALHFTINDLSHAQTSVDNRMVREIKTGIDAIKAQDVFDIIYANAGGPYGSEVLPGVQQDSDRVWNEVVLKNDGVGQDWYKATIQINAHPTEPWTAQAVLLDGSLGTKFAFERPK
jgi:hypothetical protein